MTCNPFTSLTARNSNSFLRPGNISIDSFEELLSFGQTASSIYNRGPLNSLTESLNRVLNITDLSNFPVLKEKLEQSPLNSEEIAEYLSGEAADIETVTSIVENEETRRRDVTKTPEDILYGGSGNSTNTPGTIVSVSLIGCARKNSPGIYKKVATYLDGTPGIIKGQFRGTIDDERNVTGQIVNLDRNMEWFDNKKISGSGIGKEGIHGSLNVTGFSVKGSNNTLDFTGKIKGGDYQSGFVIFDVSMVSVENSRGRGATFNIVVGSNGTPLLTIANSGSNYKKGDVLVLDGLDCKIKVDFVSDRVKIPNVANDQTPTTGAPTGSQGGIPGSTSGSTVSVAPAVPVTNFNSLSFNNGSSLAYSQDFVNLVNSLNIFVDDNYGESVSSGACGSSFLSLISDFFDFFNSLGNFQVQLPSNTTFPDLKVPPMLTALQTTFSKIIENIMNKSRNNVVNAKSALPKAGRSVDVLSKEVIDTETFYSKENQDSVVELSNGIIQRMHDQFKEPSIDLLVWMLTRLCQVSDFLSDFLQAPLNSLTRMISKNNIAKRDMNNLSNASISGATSSGAVRFNRQQLLKDANSAAQRSAAAGNMGISSTVGPPPRIATFPISDADKGEVLKNVSENGWQGFFDFSSSVIQNNFSPEWGGRIEGAGWKVILRDNPVLFAKIKRISEELNDSFTINSAFRSQEYQEKRTSSSARKSAHTEALACDIRMNPDQAMKFIPLASAYGFNGIAYYMNGGFLHVDLRSHRTSPETRSWNFSDLPRDLRNTINNHQQKLYSL